MRKVKAEMVIVRTMREQKNDAKPRFMPKFSVSLLTSGSMIVAVINERTNESVYVCSERNSRYKNKNVSAI